MFGLINKVGFSKHVFMDDLLNINDVTKILVDFRGVVYPYFSTPQIMGVGKRALKALRIEKGE